MFLSLATPTTLVALSAAFSASVQAAATPVISQDAPVPVHRPGTADLIGFNASGTYLLRNAFHPKPPEGIFAAPIFSSLIWPPDRTIRLVGDTRGIGLADLVGFGGKEVWVARNNGNGTFSPVPGRTVPWFGANEAAGNWSIERHVRVLANVRGTAGERAFGAVDVVGFGEEGAWVALNKDDGSGTFNPPKLVLEGYFGYADGWRVEQHPRVLADVDGDGKLDIVGFGSDAVYVSINTGSGSFAAPPIRALNSNFTPAAGWVTKKHLRALADLTGNGRTDIVGFGEGGVYASMSLGDGKFGEPKLALPGVFGYEHGWRVERHPRFVVDVNRDGFADIVAFGDRNVYVSFGVGDGTFSSPPTIVLRNKFTYLGADGEVEWEVGRHERTLADLDGDGAPELVGFGEDGVWVSWNDGKGAFGEPVKMGRTFGVNGGEWGTGSLRYVANVFGY
ncbi:integrin alpha N-terminal domain-containing protein [Coprinellus micaceus]|uniref:Integrin alpha N-terminal domain-containing protein n=1 Tax=Coprinellus micaceus TaxID=71717 RepID=A0A4Y7SPR2_COPMI|nr:integrin alpha N-terminal domain-containing protein [Coprinellus micaceus]